MDPMLPPPGPKRQKVRKGTHSCWECKRRKMKCVFDPLSNIICNPCRRRGSRCVSQEMPEDVWVSKYRIGHEPNTHIGRGINYTDEARTPLTPSEDHRRMSSGIPTPASTISENSRYLAFHQSSKYQPADHDVLSHNSGQAITDASVPHGKYQKLSPFLHESLPPWEDTQRICKAYHRPSVLAHEILTMPYTTLEKTGLKTAESLLEIPGPNVHPVLVARHMLQLAVFLQHVHPDLHEELKSLSESPRAMMERLADLAINLVTTKDELLGSIEALECVMIESMYQANIGSLRRSWVANRRAMGIAQLMGLDRPDNRTQFQLLDPNTRCHPKLMWLRIVFLDRQLCLLLGLPQGCLDRSMASDALLAMDAPMGRLERIHCVLSSRILERDASDPNLDDYAMTRTLDVELQKAARSLPSKWWLAPNLNTRSTDSQALFWDTRRLFAQVLHYNLLNQLHLPYMLRSSSTGRQYEYSRITCVNASREVLSRFITLRSFNQIAYSCRTVDFIALMAAMTLLLAHIDSNHPEAENLLAHQYISDRAMIEQAQENMKEVNRLNSDTLSAQSVDLLRRLLAVEVGTGNGAQSISIQGAGTQSLLPDQADDTVVSVNIPYFGIVKIASQGMSKEPPKHPSSSTTNCPLQSQMMDIPKDTIRTGTVHDDHHMRQYRHTRAQQMLITDTIKPADAGYIQLQTPSISPNALAAIGASGIPTQIAPQPPNEFSGHFLQHGGYPGLTARAEDWAFQGVDMAFFDSLMRSNANDETVDEWM